MDKRRITDISSIISKYMDCACHPKDRSLLFQPASLSAYDLAQVLLDLECTYDIDLNDLVSRLTQYSQVEIESELNILLLTE